MNKEPEKIFEIDDTKFEFFSNCCREWINKLGLLDWKTDIVLSDKKASYPEMIEGNRACILYNFEGRRATIILNKVWGEDPTPIELDRCALHECGELLLSELSRMAEDLFSFKVVELEVHKILRVLENLLVPDPVEYEDE